MPETEPTYKDMTPEDARRAGIKTGELLQGGATVEEGGRVNILEDQLETARAEMVAETSFAQIKDIVANLQKEGINVVVGQLQRLDIKKGGSYPGLYVLTRFVEFLEALRGDLENDPKRIKPIQK